MASVEYNEENIDQLIELIDNAYTKCSGELARLIENDAVLNYNMHVKRVNSKLRKLWIILNHKIGTKLEFEKLKTYDEYYSELYESSFKYYSDNTHMNYINKLNEMAILAKLNKNKIYISSRDYDMLLSYF